MHSCGVFTTLRVAAQGPELAEGRLAMSLSSIPCAKTALPSPRNEESEILRLIFGTLEFRLDLFPQFLGAPMGVGDVLR